MPRLGLLNGLVAGAIDTTRTLIYRAMLWRGGIVSRVQLAQGMGVAAQEAAALSALDSLMAALPCMCYVPAELRGRRVRQLVQQPFMFGLAP